MSHQRQSPVVLAAILVCILSGAVLDAALARPLSGAVHHTMRQVRRRADVKLRRGAGGVCHSSHRGRRRRSSCRPSARRNAFTARVHTGRRRYVGTRAAWPPPNQRSAAIPCANTDLTPTPNNLAQVDAATLCLVNAERVRHGERPLQLNARLERAAQGHSKEMVSEDYFAHVSLSGLTPEERVLATGYVPNSRTGYKIGENIAWGTLSLSTPKAIVAAWIASPGHLANILCGCYRDTAIGIVAAAPRSLAKGQAGAVYSQEFGVLYR